MKLLYCNHIFPSPIEFAITITVRVHYNLTLGITQYMYDRLHIHKKGEFHHIQQVPSPMKNKKISKTLNHGKRSSYDGDLDTISSCLDTKIFCWEQFSPEKLPKIRVIFCPTFIWPNVPHALALSLILHITNLDIPSDRLEKDVEKNCFTFRSI